MVMSKLVIVTGTGTGIGKTWVARLLVEAWGRTGKQIAGWKPIESGGREDGEILEQASTFHVKRFHAPYLLSRPVSPHLAAEAEGRDIEIRTVVAATAPLLEEADGVVLELPGGLFSPLSVEATNHELLEAFAPDRVLMVVPDRLGVLHDVTAVLRAARARIDALVLSSPETPDASTGTNEQELRRLTSVPVLGTIARGQRQHPGIDEWLKGI